mmetsp:Transcript_15525/g.22817  ORF Transcript_15525/g.22817 Transcript_15525/m.22817 type:complete len:129 (-) Transcript_15525:1481-1867(-)
MSGKDEEEAYPAPPRSSTDHPNSAESARNSRFSFRRFASAQMRRDFKDLAMQKCKPEIRDFAECAQESGLWVVFKCRDKNAAIYECMKIHNSDEGFEKYKKENREEYMLRSGNKYTPPTPPMPPKSSH